MGGVQVITDHGMNATRGYATGANAFVLPFHLIHVGRWSAHVRQIPFEFGMCSNFLQFFHDGPLTSRGNEFSLVGRNRAKAAPAKTASMNVQGELDHFVSGNRASFFILRMR